MTIEFKQAKLDNGLTIVGEVDPDAETAAIGFYVRTGARDERTELMGVSHFLEHMMFKGTEQRTADQVNREFDDIGAVYNAFTSHEMTAFWAHMLPAHLDRAEDILADILRPSLRDEDFQQERGVILEEIAMYDDVPFWVLYEAAMEHYYRDHPLHHRVLGTNESIEAMDRDSMAAYFDHHYAPDNIVVSLGGRLDFDEHVNSLNTRCGGWSSTGVDRTYPTLATGREGFTLSSNKVNQSYLLMVCPGPPVTDDDRYAAAMLSMILGDVEGSRLYWALVETGLAEEAQAQYEGRDGVGEVYIYASSAPDAAEEVEATALREIDGLVDSLREDDLVRVRAKVATAVTLAGERPAGRMRRLGRLWTYLGEYRSLDDELARINAVTLDELRDVGGRYPMTPHVTGRLQPE